MAQCAISYGGFVLKHTQCVIGIDKTLILCCFNDYILYEIVSVTMFENQCHYKIVYGILC